MNANYVELVSDKPFSLTAKPIPPTSEGNPESKIEDVNLEYTIPDELEFKKWDGGKIEAGKVDLSKVEQYEYLDGYRLTLRGERNGKIGFTFDVDSPGFDVHGNCNALLNWRDAKISSNVVGVRPYTFYRLFAGSNVVRVDENFLPQEYLSNYCYARMFNCCKKLVEMPNLRSENKSPGCYRSMFEGCTKLRHIQIVNWWGPVLLSFASMFRNCKELRDWIFPIRLSNLSNPDFCMYMFDGCDKFNPYC